MLAWTVFPGEHVLTDTPVEGLGIVTIIALLFGAYRHLECHRAGCHRIGRFTHGHLKLCAVHHPKVDGKIGDEHIRAVTREQG